MPHVVTQSCCNDASCVYACPVNCIQPTPDDPAFALSEMLFIDPVACVDCGACVGACPVGAIKPHTKLTAAEQPFARINAGYYEERPRPRPLLAPVEAPLRVRRSAEPLRVAIVGSGPAAMYAADELLTIPGAQVDVYERLPVPYGLARTGVAPDHERTRQVSRQFDLIRRQRGLRLHLGVEVGRDVAHEQLAATHHAVIYAVGASTDRRLEIPGIELPGVASATEFVAWYNGHPDHLDRTFDLAHRRAIVIGNGNVALDVARILTVDPERLRGSEISPSALSTLRRSRIEEVIVVGRRGPEHSAFTLPELVGLAHTPGIDLLTDGELARPQPRDPKLELLSQLQPTGAPRRIILRYHRSPAAVVGSERVEAVEFAAGDHPGVHETLEAGLVLTSIGYRGRPVAGLPFDADTGTIPHHAGRVSGRAGVYVAGWIKRGPNGFIGTNRSCALETVRALVEDHNAGRLPALRVTPPARSGRPRRARDVPARGGRRRQPAPS